MGLLGLPEKQYIPLATFEHRDPCISVQPSLASVLTVGSCRDRS